MNKYSRLFLTELVPFSREQGKSISQTETYFLEFISKLNKVKQDLMDSIELYLKAKRYRVYKNILGDTAKIQAATSQAVAGEKVAFIDFAGESHLHKNILTTKMFNIDTGAPSLKSAFTKIVSTFLNKGSDMVGRMEYFLKDENFGRFNRKLSAKLYLSGGGKTIKIRGHEETPIEAFQSNLSAEVWLNEDEVKGMGSYGAARFGSYELIPDGADHRKYTLKYW